MSPLDPTPVTDSTGATGSPGEATSMPKMDAGARRAYGQPAKGQVFRRKIDCGSSTETSAEQLILRNPDHMLRGRRRPGR